MGGILPCIKFKHRLLISSVTDFIIKVANKEQDNKCRPIVATELILIVHRIQ